MNNKWPLEDECRDGDVHLKDGRFEDAPHQHVVHVATSQRRDERPLDTNPNIISKTCYSEINVYAI